MIYKHQVKYNGKYYPAGTDVPVGGKPVEDKKAEKPKEDDFSQYMNAPEIEEESTEVKHTKTEINRMPTADLKKLAKENGIDNGLSGAEIKKALIEKFEL